MSTEVALFLLRIISGLLLISMLLALFFIIWRNYRSAAAQLKASRRTYGHLIALAEIDGNYVATGETFPLLPLTSLGRSPTNTIIIKDSFASSEHARVFMRDGQWWLEDRQSRNGTLLNSERIDEPIVITDKDIISIGNRSYRLELGI